MTAVPFFFVEDIMIIKFMARFRETVSTMAAALSFVMAIVIINRFVSNESDYLISLLLAMAAASLSSLVFFVMNRILKSYSIKYNFKKIGQTDRTDFSKKEAA